MRVDGGCQGPHRHACVVVAEGVGGEVGNKWVEVNEGWGGGEEANKGEKKNKNKIEKTQFHLRIKKKKEIRVL